MKRICHIALMHGGGGVDVYIRSLLKNAPSTVENELICSPDFGNGNFPPDCKLHLLNIPRDVSVVEDIKAIFFVRKIIRQTKPDVVYCHSSMAGAVGRAAALGCKTKVIYNPHGWSFDMRDKSAKARAVYRAAERLLAHFTDKIVCISHYEKKVAVEQRVCRDDKCYVIQNGIDLTPYQTAVPVIEREYFTVGCAARISAQKDPLFFAEVMRLVAKEEPSARFVWIGDGEMRAEFEQALKEKGIFERTTVTGWLESPVAEIQKTDVCVLFSKWEGFGLCLLDYLAAGKPVVARKVGGVGEIVTPQVGAALESDSPQAFAAEILALRDEKKRSEMLPLCIARANEFDIKTVAEKTRALVDVL
ncbi:MAG TPA: hypothetical protein DDY98_07365 [Ruminococcaceae bacterium]|nr:hypothetical protein [Oscillospiraceae bacterium]